MWAGEVFVKLKIYFPTETFQEGRKESECVKEGIFIEKVEVHCIFIVYFFMLHFIVYFVNTLYTFKLFLLLVIDAWYLHWKNSN